MRQYGTTLGGLTQVLNQTAVAAGQNVKRLHAGQPHSLLHGTAQDSAQVHGFYLTVVCEIEAVRRTKHGRSR